MNARKLIAAAVVAASALALPSLAAAGKPGPGGTTRGGNSLTLVQLTPRDGGPAFGDTVTFSLVTTSTQPYVRVDCYQNGTNVYTETNGFFPSYPWGQEYTLGPTLTWTGGGASCTAQLITATRKGYSTLAQISFAVSA